MDVFAVLAEPVRYRIVEILATGEHTSGQLADVLHHEFGVGWPAVSQHLRMLRGSGFRYGWPYRVDPLSSHLLTISRRPNRGRGQRGRSERPIVFDVTEDNDLWQWLGD